MKDKVEEEKRNREHLLQLSQILAQEVMEKSKIVAGTDLFVTHLRNLGSLVSAAMSRILRTTTDLN